VINEEIISKRYADAFLANAKGPSGREERLDALLRAKRIIRDNQPLKDFIENIAITNSEKEEVVDVVFKDDFDEDMRNFLKLLVEKKRINLFIDIAEYARIHYAHGVELDALLKTSYPLDTDTIRRIKDALEKRMKKKIHLYVGLDADLVGGAYARIGNIIIDGSAKRRLEDMKEKLYAMKVV
jgi:F-type H+-transporting ATPase subunit delta